MSFSPLMMCCCTTCMTHLIVETFLHHQSISLQVEQFLWVHRHPQRHVVGRVDLHQLDVGRVVLWDGHWPRWDGADWEAGGQAGRKNSRQTGINCLFTICLIQRNSWIFGAEHQLSPFVINLLLCFANSL